MNLDDPKIEKNPLHTNKQEQKVRYTYTILMYMQRQSGRERLRVSSIDVALSAML